MKDAPPPPRRTPGLSREIAAVLLVVLGLFIGGSLYSLLRLESVWEMVLSPTGDLYFPRQANLMGPAGAYTAVILLRIFGLCAFVTVLWSFLLARSVWKGAHQEDKPTAKGAFLTILAAVVLTISAAVLCAVVRGFSGGGLVGTRIAFALVQYFNEAGTILISSAIFLLALGISTGVGFSPILRLFTGLAKEGSGYLSESGRLTKNLASGGVRSALQFSRIGANVLLFPMKRRPAVSVEETQLAELADDIPTGQGIDYINFREDPPRKSKLSPQESKSLSEVDEEDDTVEEPLRIVSNVGLIADGDEPEDDEQAVSEASKQTLAAKVQKRFRRTVERKTTTKTGQKRKDFTLPPPELLVGSGRTARTMPRQKEITANSKRLEQTLLNFRLGGKVVEVHPGPVITLYQFEPAPGVKVQRIISLADDLALALKVASVRVYAPVPGKGTVGIEVPNAEREIVRLRELIEVKDFLDPQLELGLVLGKDTFGDPVIADLSKMPHLLIAGATGTGKSVCINSLLLSLLYKHTPDELAFIMIDPKMLELSTYEDIPHLKAPVVTVAKRARGVLWWAVEEMERRYELMKSVGVRSLASYNALVATKSPRGDLSARQREIIELAEKDVVATSSERALLDRESGAPSPTGGVAGANQLVQLPRIVIVVDELADLMLTVGREIEELLTRLAQKARAAGIHLILATQRPSVNVITGLIKANFPSRISFKVASRIDARTVMDTSGSEKLLGQGDMLFLSAGAGRAKRLHSPFVSDKEVHDVVEWLKGQGAPEFDERIESMIERYESSESGMGEGPGGAEDYDPLYDQAVTMVIDKGFASTSMVQRVFRIGYNRAARILETMEREGVVGPADGAKPRQVLVGGASQI